MINKDPIDVSEDLEVLLKAGDKIDFEQFINNIEEFHNKYCHKNYDHFSVGLITKDGKSGVVFIGLRKENQEETKKRVAIEEAKAKHAEEVELKQYLMLKKKYGKKGDNE